MSNIVNLPTYEQTADVNANVDAVKALVTSTNAGVDAVYRYLGVPNSGTNNDPGASAHDKLNWVTSVLAGVNYQSGKKRVLKVWTNAGYITLGSTAGTGNVQTYPFYGGEMLNVVGEGRILHLYSAGNNCELRINDEISIRTTVSVNSGFFDLPFSNNFKLLYDTTKAIPHTNIVYEIYV